jgi:hypothetical protein
VELDYPKTYRNGVIDLHAVNSDIKDRLLEEIRASRKWIRLIESELVVLKRQKKTIQDDLDESIPKRQTIQDAYASVLCHKVMSASGKQKGRKFDQERFRKDVGEYYETLRCEGGEKAEAQMVPSSLVMVPCEIRESRPSGAEESCREELSYLFGVGEAILSDPRNSKWSYLRYD